MPLDILTEEKAIEAIQNFFREKPFLFFGTGMSCAIDASFGMDALKDALSDEMKHQTLRGQQSAEWDSVASSLNKGVDLENALNAVNDPGLLKLLTDITGNFIANIDRKFSYQIAKGSIEWPAIRLLKKIVDTLPEGDRILHVLTPNYDMLCEYACDYACIPYTNGFTGCIERRTDWDAADCSLRVRDAVVYGSKSKKICKHRKHIRIYKVHGSLNYFLHRNTFIENSAWMWYPPEFAERIMITPGLLKYQTLQRYRQELLKSADTAIERSSHFLFLGYGFNDLHLEEYIKRKLITQACHGLIITKESNPRIESLIALSDNLWLICNYDGGGTDSTRIYNKKYSDSLILAGQKLWDVVNFSFKILGG
ncbi:hypothetical protein C4544_03970 [candidate division WS5 bacterium]|uniref:Uncharacterized protein n=1 Tax=candidate division WS5 bacterium TaxID=2093353 RepID=A0A419DCW1_9BACT|nr:MAG: hypothetical protein C4544_03970 [candidate division WS5 bacterium]